tara:strand:+ start:183 stop:290 length:108 start_codon:yes stop_codon:yes gene_type:complete
MGVLDDTWDFYFDEKDWAYAKEWKPNKNVSHKEEE